MTILCSSAGKRAAGSLFLIMAVSSLVVLSACSAAPATTSTKLVAPVVPDKADYSTPLAAVRTYLGYTTYAYRMANSDLASAAASPYEGVRVDSYIELNRQKDQGIEQLLVKFAKRAESKEGTGVVLAASEEWRYRYFSLSRRVYTSPMYTASYDATYTLVKDPKGWLVDKVAAKALTPVK